MLISIEIDFICHCEQSEAIHVASIKENLWIASPIKLARNDEYVYFWLTNSNA